MKLAKWDPFREVDEIMDNYNKAMTWPSRQGRELKRFDADWAPKVDISETDDRFCIKAEIPGIKQDDVKISIEGHVLSVKGENKQEKEDKGERYHRIERYYGSFSRSFSLPENVDEENVEATFKDGLLILSIPKTEVAKPKSIEVKVK